MANQNEPPADTLVDRFRIAYSKPEGRPNLGASWDDLSEMAKDEWRAKYVRAYNFFKEEA